MALAPNDPDQDPRYPVYHRRPSGPAPVPHGGHDQGMAPYPTQPEDRRGDDDDEISLRDYWRVFVKRRWLVLGVAALIAAATLVYSLLQTPYYLSTVTLQIDSNSLRIVKTEGVEAVETYADFMGTQLELLRSRAIAQRTVRQLALVGDKAFESAVERPGGLAGIKAFFARKDGAAPAVSLEQREGQAVGRVMLGLTVTPVRGSRLVKVSYESPDPRVAARVANGVAQAFMQSNLDRRVDNSQFARTFLEDRLQQLKVKLEESEKALIAYSQEQGIVGANENASLAEANLTALNASLADIQGQRMRAEARAQQSTALAGASTEALKSPVLDTLRQKSVELKAEYESKRPLFKPDYPEMAQLQRRIAEVEAQIQAELQSFQRAARAEYDAALTNENLLRKQIDTARAAVLDLQQRSIQYNILKREADTNRQLYDGLLQRYKEIGVTGDVGNNNVSVVDPALDGYRFKPNIRKNLLLGLLMGLLLGMGLAFLVEKLDDTLETPEDVERQLGIPVIGVVPKVPAEAFAETVADPKSSFSEAYRSLRTALQYSTDQGAPKILLVTSSVASEGKSTSSVMLGRKFTQLGLRVLLIDADLRKPSLHKHFAMANEGGLSAYLAGQIDGPELFRDSGEEGLSVINAGQPPPNPAELLATPRFRSLLTVATHNYDQVIVDSPPLLGLADVPVMVSAADGCMIVIEAGSTRVGVARGALKRLAASRARVTGALLVKFDARAAGYGYGYGYGYADYYYHYAYGTDGRRLKHHKA